MEKQTLSGKPILPSEKHDVLYSKARHVLSQRHIKRPWFNLNPFLEKTDETIDLENYLPEESKYIKPLESLVLSESYHSEFAIDTRELIIDNFFDYLNSTEWEAGCSIRVLEGQLMDQLLVGLYRLEKEGATVRHTTYAFAKNKRTRSGCYKLADKESYGVIEENLLLEFAYFGRLTKDKANTITQNPLEYLRLGIPEYIESDVTEDLPEMLSIPEFPKRKNRSASISVDSSNARSLILNLKKDSNSKPLSNWARRGSLMAKPLNAIRALNAMQPQGRRQSLAAPPSALGMPPILSLKPLTEKRRESLTPEQPAKGRKRQDSVAWKRKRFSAVDYLPDFEEDTDTPEKDENEDEETADEEERDNFFGEEFNLSVDKDIGPTVPENVEAKLQRRKIELQQKRLQKKKYEEQIKEKNKNKGIPSLPPLDMSKVIHADRSIMHHTLKMPDELPTFEEFITLLKEDEYYDPRYRNKVRMKGKKIAQRYYMAKGVHRSSVLFTPSMFEHFGPAARCHDRRASTTNIRRSSIEPPENSKVAIRLPTLQEKNRRSQKSIKLQSQDADNRLEVPSDFDKLSDEIKGVTDSEPCKDHYLKCKGSSQKLKEETVTMRNRRSSEFIASGCRKNNDNESSDIKISLNEKQRRMSSTNIGRRSSVQLSANSPPKSPLPSLFPKMSMHDEDAESSDTDSDDSDTADDEMSTFDATKLNIRYSIERLRKKRRAKTKKKPAFFDILAKYYKMQAAMTAFRKGSAGKERRGAQQRAKRLSLKGLFKGMQGKEETSVNKEETPVIGKLKKFNFLDTKPTKRRLNLEIVSTADFSVPPLAAFQESLREALDNFVVRREIVLSDVQTFYRPATSVTFTRSSCFQHRHRE